MGDPDEYSATNIALSNMTDINNLWERVEELERKLERVEELERKLESLDKDMNTVFEAINAFHHILYLKNPEEK